MLVILFTNYRTIPASPHHLEPSEDNTLLGVLLLQIPPFHEANRYIALKILDFPLSLRATDDNALQLLLYVPTLDRHAQYSISSEHCLHLAFQILKLHQNALAAHKDSSNVVRFLPRLQHFLALAADILLPFAHRVAHKKVVKPVAKDECQTDFSISPAA